MNAHEIATETRLARVEAKVDRLVSLLETLRAARGEEWLTYAEAAARLGCSVSTIARRVDSGELQAQGRGKLRRVLVEV